MTPNGLSVRRLVLGALGVALATLAAGCNLEEIALDRLNVDASVSVDMSAPDARETITSDIPFSGQRLVVDNPIGQIAIETVEDPGYVAVRPTIHVEATKSVKGMDLDQLRIQTEQTADETRIRVTTAIPTVRNTPEQARRSGEPIGWVDFKIRLPQAAVVTLHQSAGSIVVDTFRGELTATTELGNIDVRNATTSALSLRSKLGTLSVAQSTVDGDLSLETSAGVIQVSNVRFNRAEADTQAGEVSVQNVRGQGLDVSTQFGEIDVAEAELSQLDLASQMGEIHLQDSRIATGTLSTQWGEITVQVRPDAVPRIRAETQAGAVDVYRLPETLRASLHRRGSWLGESLELAPSDAQGTLDLATQLGDVQIVFPRATSP